MSFRGGGSDAVSALAFDLVFAGVVSVWCVVWWLVPPWSLEDGSVPDDIGIVVGPVSWSALLA